VRQGDSPQPTTGTPEKTAAIESMRGHGSKNILSR
jgi:hypothetical protein